VRHTIAWLALSSSPRTGNASNSVIGWHTVTGKGLYRLEMADVDARQAIEKGLIGPVESVLPPVPYGMDSGWSTWEDAMSSRARW
jgi:hypothetical protein